METLYYTIQNRGSSNSIDTDNQPSTVILLHGLFGDHKNLQMLARSFLDSKFQVISVDLCNHGQSYHSDEINYTLMSDDIIRLIEHLNLSQVTLIGHSMGGKVAMACALRYPQLVEKLVILDIAPIKYTDEKHNVISVFSKIFKALYTVGEQKITQRSEAIKILNQSISDPAITQFLAKSFIADRSSRWKFNIDALYGQYKEIMNWDIAGIYSKSTLFIKGEQSDYIDLDHKQAIIAQFPMAKIHVIPKAGHWLHAQQPEKTERIISTFLNS